MSDKDGRWIRLSDLNDEEFEVFLQQVCQTKEFFERFEEVKGRQKEFKEKIKDV